MTPTDVTQQSVTKKWPGGHRRPGNVSAERDAALVRGAMVERFEACLVHFETAVRGALKEVEARRVPPGRFANEVALAAFQRVAVALFPEEYADRPRPADPGVVAAGGPAGAGRRRVEGYARLLAAVAEA